MEHTVVFVLTGAIVCMQVDLLLSETMMGEVQLRDDDVHLPGGGGGGMASQQTPKTLPLPLPGGKEIEWTRLQWVRGIVDLLSVVKTVMGLDGNGVGR